MGTILLDKKQTKHIFLQNSSFATHKQAGEPFTYEEIVARKAKQDRLVAEGKMEKPKRIIRELTVEEKEEFKNCISAEELFVRLDNKFFAHLNEAALV